MLIREDLNLHSKWMLIWQPVTLWYTALNLNIARLLNGFLFLNKLLSCFLCAFRWVVSSGRKLAVVYGVSIGNKGMPPSISIKNKGFKMASKSLREDSRWPLSSLGRIQDGSSDVIEDDLIQDGGVIYSLSEGVWGVKISSRLPLEVTAAIERVEQTGRNYQDRTDDREYRGRSAWRRRDSTGFWYRYVSVFLLGWVTG